VYVVQLCPAVDSHLEASPRQWVNTSGDGAEEGGVGVGAAVGEAVGEAVGATVGATVGADVGGDVGAGVGGDIEDVRDPSKSPKSMVPTALEASWHRPHCGHTRSATIPSGPFMSVPQRSKFPPWRPR